MAETTSPSSSVDAAAARNRAELVRGLEIHKTTSDWEERSRKSMLALLASRPRCFERDCEPGHFTASVLVVNPEHTKVLLMHHKKLGKWLQMGGHADGESDLRAVALKELVEESGLPIERFLVEPNIFNVDMHVFPAPPNPKPGDLCNAHIHFDVRFRAVLDENVPIPGNAESFNVRWFSLDSLRDSEAPVGVDERLAGKLRLP